MSSDIVFLTGKNFKFYNLTPQELNEFTRIGNGADTVKMADLEVGRSFNAAIICAHGYLEKNTSKLFRIQLLDENILGSDQIELLQHKLNIRHFYLFSCFSGALPHTISTCRLQKGTTITIFSSGKYPSLTPLTEALTRKIFEFYKQHVGIPTNEVDRKCFVKHALFAPWPTVRCEITEQKGELKLTAFKVRAPKQVDDINNYVQYVYSGNKLSPIAIGDAEVLQRWTKEGRMMRVVDLKLYKDYSLIDAAIRGQLARAAAWINTGASINFDTPASGINLSALFCASILGHAPVVQLLVTKGAQIEYRSDCAGTPLYLACLSGHEKAVKTLIQAGADVEAIAVRGYRPLHVACECGHIETAFLLLQHNACIDPVSDAKETPLTLASIYEQWDLAQLLIEHGANVNHKARETGITPLFLASETGCSGIIPIFIQAGAKIDDPTEEGWTALYAACCFGHPEVVKLLLEAGANINHTSKEGATPLYVACQQGHLDIIEILIASGADINAPNAYGCIPLHAAIVHQHPDVAQYLIENGSLLQHLSASNTTPLHVACELGMQTIVRSLIALKVDLNLQDKGSATALYYACQNGHIDTARLLLESGADKNISLDDGSIAIDAAYHKGHMMIVQMLTADTHTNRKRKAAKLEV